MSFFSNKSLNILNIHYCLRAMGWEMCSMFTLSYLYKQGLALPAVFVAYAGMLCVRTLTRPVAMRLCLSKGVHFTLIAGTVVFACRYPVMIPIDGLNLWLVPFMLVSGLADVLYWVSYHNYFAAVGSEQDRGASVGIREAISTIVAVLGPLCGGFLLSINRTYAFMLPFVLTLVSVLPLLKTPEIPKPLPATKEERKKVGHFGFFVFIGDGWFYQAGAVWPLIVFMMLNDNYGNFGFILALAAFFRAVGNLFFGSMIDKGKGRQICFIGYGLHIIVYAVRGFFAYSVPAVVACDFFAAIAYCFSMTGLMSAVYNATKKASHPLYFTYYTELGWDIGAISAMLVCAGLTFSGFNVRWGLTVAVCGAVLSLAVLNRYYRSESEQRENLNEAA